MGDTKKFSKKSRPNIGKFNMGLNITVVAASNGVCIFPARVPGVWPPAAYDGLTAGFGAPNPCTISNIIIEGSVEDHGLGDSTFSDYFWHISVVKNAVQCVAITLPTSGNAVETTTPETNIILWGCGTVQTTTDEIAMSHAFLEKSTTSRSFMKGDYVVFQANNNIVGGMVFLAVIQYFIKI